MRGVYIRLRVFLLVFFALRSLIFTLALRCEETYPKYSFSRIITSYFSRASTASNETPYQTHPYLGSQVQCSAVQQLSGCHPIGQVSLRYVPHPSTLQIQGWRIS